VCGGSDATGEWFSASTEEYPNELRERAIRLVVEVREQDYLGHRTLAGVSRELML
jgi:hypothetical protein